MNLEDVKAQAEKEFKEEKFREKVEMEKIRLRKRSSLWVKIWPWTIVRKDAVTPKDRWEWEKKEMADRAEEWRKNFWKERERYNELSAYTERLKQQIAEKGFRPVC